MANFTALKTAINNAIKTNGNEEITGAILQAILDAMVETLGDSAINDLENAITTEVTNRENAVGGVADNLAAEVQARQALDYNVNNRINAEEYNRQNADAALSQTMNQGFQTLGSQMTALNAAISALNAAYQNGYLYGGIATPSSSPSNNKCFYIALQGGTYTNFGGVGVVEGINILKNDSGWKVEHIYDQTTLLNEFYLLRQQVIRALASVDSIVIQGDVTNAPDEEDLTSSAQHLLKFKDRAYSPLNFSGLGMKILRKNILPLNDSVAFNGFLEGVTAEETLAGSPELIFWDRMSTRFVGIKDGIYYAAWTDDDNYVPVSTSLVYMYDGTPYQWTGSDFIVDENEVPNLVNCLTQDMINEANTIYIIRYDYTLKEDITIPANCVLQFDGGSISGEHTITGANTGIQAGLVKIFSTDVTIAGSWNVVEAYPEWFGSVSANSGVDNRIPIQKTIDAFKNVFINGVYYINSADNNGVAITLNSNCRLLGKSQMSWTIPEVCSCLMVNSDNILKLIEIKGHNEIGNIHLIAGDNAPNNNCTAIFAEHANDSCFGNKIHDMCIKMFNYAMELTVYETTIENVAMPYNIHGMYLHGTETVEYTLVTCINCGGRNYAYNFKVDNMLSCSFIGCSADKCGIDIQGNPSELYEAAFVINKCKDINILSFDSEGNNKVLSLVRSFNIKFDANILYRFNELEDYSELIYVEICNNITIDTRTRLAGFEDTPKIFKYVGSNTATVHTNFSKDYVNVLNGATTETFTEVKRGLISTIKERDKIINTPKFNDYYYGFGEDTYNTEHTITIDGSEVSEMPIYDHKEIDIFGDKETLIFLGNSTSRTKMTLRTTAQKYFIGQRKVVFENILFERHDTIQSPANLLFFEDTDVIFINCIFDNDTGFNDLYLINGNKSHIVFENTIVANLLNAKNIFGCSITSTVDSSFLEALSTVRKNSLCLPINSQIKLSNSLIATVKAEYPVVAIFETKATQTSDLNSITNALTTYEKSLVIGSKVWIVNQYYYWNGTTWVDATGTPV